MHNASSLGFDFPCMSSNTPCCMSRKRIIGPNAQTNNGSRFKNPMAVSSTTDKAECSLPVDLDRREYRTGFLRIFPESPPLRSRAIRANLPDMKFGHSKSPRIPRSALKSFGGRSATTRGT
jgi:hypothetical protein